MGKKAICEGEVVLMRDKQRSISFYTEEFTLDDSITSIGEARSIIKKIYITDRLRRSMDNFKKVRTCQVISLEDTKDKPDNSKLDGLMKQALNLGCIPEGLDRYEGEAKERALKDAIKKEKDRMKRKGKKDQTKESLSDPI